MYLKTENYYLKTYMKICVGEKAYKKYIKYYLKTENNCLKTQTKYFYYSFNKRNKREFNTKMFD